MALEQEDLDQITALLDSKLSSYTPPDNSKELKATIAKLQAELAGVTELVTKPPEKPEEKKGDVKDPTIERVKALEQKLQESEAKAAKAQLESTIDGLLGKFKLRDDSQGIARELLRAKYGQGFKASEAGYLNDSGESLEDAVKAFFESEGKALLKANRQVSGVEDKGEKVGNPSTTDSKDIAWGELVF